MVGADCTASAVDHYSDSFLKGGKKEKNFLKTAKIFQDSVDLR